MKNPLVSIIVPVYNGKKYLREAIDSALNQTYKNCEVLVINDGSIDSTEEIALSYGNKIRYFKKENGGVSSALNLGIEHMNGEYFSWLSHDDVYYHNKIEKQLNALYDVGDMTKIVWGDYDSYYEDTRTLFERERFAERYGIEKLTNSVYPIFHFIVSGCCVLIHKSHFKRVGLFREDLRLTQEVDMFFRMFRGNKTIFLDYPTYKERLHREQVSSNNRLEIRGAVANQLLGFANALTNQEIKDMFSSLREFYRFVYFKICQHAPCDYAASVYYMFKSRHTAAEWARHTEEGWLELESVLSGKPNIKSLRICIFGAWQMGQMVYAWLKFFDIVPYAFADNDINKHGICIAQNVKCISFDDLAKNKDSTLVIVASGLYSEEIEEQLAAAEFPYVVTLAQMNRFRADYDLRQ